MGDRDLGQPIAWEGFRSLLVPLDGSRLAEEVLPAARAIGLRTGATVTLLHVLERGAPATVHGERHLRSKPDAEAYLAQIAQRIAADGLTVVCHVHENPEQDVARSLAEHADELGSDLIVLASHGAGGLREFLFGSIAQQVVRRGRWPVLVVQVRSAPVAGSERGFSLRSAAIALNGTGEAEAAIAPAARLATAFGAALHLIFAVPTLTTVDPTRGATATLMPGATRALLDLESENAERYLQEQAVVLTRQGIATDAAVVRGEPATAVVTAAERQGSDLLAIATHGRSSGGSIWAGSVGPRMLARFQRPLLLVPSAVGT